MRLWTKLLIGAVALVLVLLAAAAIFITQVDPNEYRGVIADGVEDATGRKLRIGGDLRIKLLPVPSLEAHDIAFANASWASQPDMARVKRLRADIALLPFLEGRTEIRRFDAVEPVVYLETNAEGKGNWEFSDKTVPVPESGADREAAFEGLKLVVREIGIDNARIEYLDGKTGKKTVLDVDALTVGTRRPGGRVTLALRAAYQGLPVTLDGKLGAVGAILKNQPTEVDLEGTLGEARLRIEGTVAGPLQGKGMRLDVGLKSASTKPITDVSGVQLEEFGPVDMQLGIVEQDGYFSFDPVEVSARLRGTDVGISGSVKNISSDLKARAKAAFVDLEGSVGESRFHVAGDMDDPFNATGLRLDVSADAKSTRGLSELAGIELEEIGPLKLDLKVLGQGDYFDLDDIKLTLRPRDLDATVRGSVKDMALGSDAQAKPAKVNLEGSFADATFSIAGEIAKPNQGKGLRLNVALDTDTTRPLTALADLEVEELGPLGLKLTLIEKNNRYDLDAIDVTARPRDARLTVKGSILDVVGSPQPDLDLALSAKTLRQLDGKLSDVGPVSLSATARPRGKVIELQEFVAQVGKSDLSGSATVDMGGERPLVDGSLRATQIDLRELAPPAEKSEPAAATENASDGKIFPDKPLPLDALKKINAKAELAIGRLVTPKLVFEKVKVAAKLDDGDLIMKPAVQVAGGALNGTITIDARTQPARFSADVEAKKVSIGALTKEIRGYEISKGLDSNLQMKLRGQGDSVRALMGGLDGNVALAIGDGQLNNSVLDRVGADLFTQMLSVAVPTGETQKTTAFKCGVVRFAVEKGDAIAEQTLVMETEKVLLTGGGLIDLKTENLDLGGKLAARKGIRLGAGSLSSLVRVQGTLADPRLGTDLKGLATTGAKVGIAVATGGLSLLAESVYGHVSEDDQPCQTALTRDIEVTPATYKAWNPFKKK